MTKRIPVPNLFIIGPPKTATTSLAYWISQHPDVFVSQPKETHFFEAEYENGVNYYLHKYFRHWNGEHVICDAMPMNLVVQYCAPRIKEVSPGATMVAILRNPWERMYADWYNWSSMRPGRSIEDFNDAITWNRESFSFDKFKHEHEFVPFRDSRGGCYVPTYIEASLYGNLIKNYEDHGFHAAGIKFEDLVSNPQAICNKIFDHMGISNYPIPDLSERNMVPNNHISKIADEVKEMLSEDNFQYLYELFSDDAKILSKIAKHDFNERWGLI